MSNTIIQIKRSDANSQPANLSAGEFAYSYLSNTLFLGTTDGSSVINVGGLLYTQTIDAATAANTANTLVKRRSDGAFFGQLFGNANTDNFEVVNAGTLPLDLTNIDGGHF